MKFFSRAKAPIKPLPFPVYFLTVCGLVLLGFFDSLYLQISHYRVYTDIGYSSFCAITKAINCDTVSQSPYSILGSIPVPLWGVFGYALLLILMTMAADKQAEHKRIWATLFFLSLLYSVISLVLAYLSTFHIRSYCILCVATYAINLLILYFSWLIRRRFDATPLLSGLAKDLSFLLQFRKKIVLRLTPLLAIWIVSIAFLPPYWKINPPPFSENFPHGLTEQGFPWIGAENPKLVISEFSDYQCFQCKKMHFHLRGLVANHPDSLRLVHRHFPMDDKFNPLLKQPFHTGSGSMALIAIHAASLGKFWQTNDLLFEIAGQKRPFNTTEIAEKIGIAVADLSSAMMIPANQLKLRRDIITGLKLGITGTPSFTIDSRVYLGQLPLDIIKKAIE